MVLGARVAPSDPHLAICFPGGPVHPATYLVLCLCQAQVTTGHAGVGTLESLLSVFVRNNQLPRDSDSIRVFPSTVQYLVYQLQSRPGIQKWLSGFRAQRCLTGPISVSCTCASLSASLFQKSSTDGVLTSDDCLVALTALHCTASGWQNTHMFGRVHGRRLMASALPCLVPARCSMVNLYSCN